MLKCHLSQNFRSTGSVIFSTKRTCIWVQWVAQRANVWTQDSRSVRQVS